MDTYSCIYTVDILAASELKRPVVVVPATCASQRQQTIQLEIYVASYTESFRFMVEPSLRCRWVGILIRDVQERVNNL